MSDSPTTVIADDHAVFRAGVRMTLTRAGFRVVGEAWDRNGAIDAVLQERPQVCLLDIYMPGGGLEAARRITQVAPSTYVVMLTVSNSTEDLLAALQAGAVGYLPKDIPPDRLPATLCGVLRGEAALPRALVGRILEELRDFTAPAAHEPHAGEVDLTPRESEILRMLAAGLTTGEISKILTLSPITVRRHISTAVGRLGVANRAAAMRAICAAVPGRSGGVRLNHKGRAVSGPAC